MTNTTVFQLYTGDSDSGIKQENVHKRNKKLLTT